MTGVEERRVRVGVVDDHPLLIAGIRALLASRGSRAEYAAGADTVEALLETRAPMDVVILDARLNDGSSAEDNARRLAAEGLCVVLHADRSHREAVPATDRGGAKGLVWKNDPPRTLLDAISAVARGERWDAAVEGPAVRLTGRETQVLRLYASGLKYAATAAAMDPPISLESVKTYLSRIRRRYDAVGRPASTRMELRQRALEDGLLPPEL